MVRVLQRLGIDVVEVEIHAAMYCEEWKHWREGLMKATGLQLHDERKFLVSLLDPDKEMVTAVGSYWARIWKRVDKRRWK